MDVSSGLKGGGRDGNSAVVLNLARSLAELAEAGEFDFEAYAPHGTSVPDVPERFIRRIPLLPLCSAEHRQVRYGLATRLTVAPPDVLLNVANGYHPRFQRSKQASIVHDVAFEIDEWKPYYTPQLTAFLHDNTAIAVRQADVLIPVSQHTADDLQRIFGVEKQRLRVIHSGYDEERFTPKPDSNDRAVRERLGAGRFVVAIGTIQPRKNYDRLIRAFVRYRRESGSNDRLVIAGANGWMAEATLALARQHASDGVVLWGTAERDEVPALMRTATAFLFPALYEGFGIPVIEAMACGAPVVASNAGPVPEISGGAALLVDPYSEDALRDAIKQVLSSPDLRAGLTSKSLTRARDFSWRKAAKAYVEVVRELRS